MSPKPDLFDSPSSMSVLISNLPTAQEEDDIMNNALTKNNNSTQDEERTGSMSISIDDNDNNTVSAAAVNLLHSSNLLRRSSTGDARNMQSKVVNNKANDNDTLLSSSEGREQQRRRSTTHVYKIQRSNSSCGLSSFSDLSNFLASEGLLNDCKKKYYKSSSMRSLMSNLSEYDNEGDETSTLMSEQTNEALKDFALQLKFYGREDVGLDYEAFNMLLDDIDYNLANKPNRPSRDELWDDLLTEVALASSSSSSPLIAGTSFTTNENEDNEERPQIISIQDLKNLYNSEPYKLSQQASFNNGEVLMSYIENLFKKADVNDDNTLQIDELKLFLKMLFDGREPTEDELNEAMKTLDEDGDGNIDFDEFKSFMLKANVNSTCEISADFNEGLLSPSHTSEDEFVTELETYTKSHRAVSHHLLANLATASFGKKETADMLLRFLSAYAQFNSGFIANVETLVGLLDDNPKHAEILKANLDEEMGKYDDETLEACEEMDISRNSVDGIPHRELFTDLVEFVETVLQRSYSKFIPSYICDKLRVAIAMCQGLGKLGLLAALYFGSELIVPEIYSSILQGLRNSIGVTNEEARFLILHIDMDQDHAEALREIIVENCLTKADRLTLANCTKMLLDARVAFYDSLIKYTCLDPMSRQLSGGLRTTNAYDAEASKSDCMSDFTARPIVFDMCKEHVKGATVLDVGCGEGYVARGLVDKGAIKIVGVDINSDMVKAASSHPAKKSCEYYIEGDASRLKETLLKTTNKTNLMPGAGFDLGLFDLSVAVFVLNYLTITDMDKTFKDVSLLLKPGGHFVFIVPHPFMSDHDGENFGFTQTDSKSSNYFALRDQLLEGHINTLSGERLKIGMFCKTFEDYIKTARKYGFEIVEMEEARVSPENLNENPAFFDSVNGVPLHLVVKVRKPAVGIVDNSANVAAANTLSMLPKKLTWGRSAMRNPENAFFVRIPDLVKKELYKASLECFNRGISVEDLDFEGDFPSRTFAELKNFAVYVRNALLHETGLVVLKGLDLDVFGLDDVKSVACSKIAYYLLCNHIGAVDGSARGRLFDVKDNNIDANKNDNILFSVSNCEANWHTDGASKDRVYDAVSLLCIHPSVVGGKSIVSNACNAYDELNQRLPGFLMNELHRPVSRDILENGKGNKKVDLKSQLSRADSIMSLRISYNSYPIFDIQQDRMRFRYMRFWIESAHKKMHWKVPTLLRIAMDCLDDTLDKGCCFNESLERGDIIICNNACVAHGRTSFRDVQGKPRRHLVRAWMQVQKVDLIKPSNHHSDDMK